MKVISLALAILLLAAVWTQAHCDTLISHTSVCCMEENFVRRKISPKHIRSCRPTAPNCSHQAMIVTLTQGKEVCVDPKKIKLKACE